MTEKEIVWKLIFLWLEITIGSLILAKIQYYFSDSPLRWKYWIEEHALGILYKLALYLGLIVLGIYLVVKYLQWFFK